LTSVRVACRNSEKNAFCIGAPEDAGGPFVLTAGHVITLVQPGQSRRDEPRDEPSGAFRSALP
jgi:hypothetical protein